MYRNAIYNGREQSMTVFTWDNNGKRVNYVTSFSPYLYVEDSKGDKVSIYGTKLKKKIFHNNFERRKFLADSGIKRVYENLSPNQQFLIDCYWQENEKNDFSKYPLKTMFIDIETYSVDSFPNTEDPTHPVNIITCYDSLTEKYHTFGTKPFTGKIDKVTYKHCKNERELFISFIEYLEKDFPDILSGWNSEFFDIPYIINRCERILGEEYARRLSPLKIIYSRPIKGKFGKELNRWYIDGISCIDYLDIYRKFCQVMRESYKLDAIAEIELGENKIDYGDTDLATLSDTNWDKFVEYNIHDVRLLVKLEQKLQYISLLRMLAYVGLTTFEAALGSVSLLTGAMCIKARHKNEIMSTFIRSHKEGTNPGAYVSEPSRGFQQYFATFDAASLYPSVMMSLNMSPETKIGKFAKNEKGNVEIYHVSGKTFELTPSKFAEFVKAEKCCFSKAGILFSQKKRGIVPLFLDEYFQRRVQTKNLIRETDKKLQAVDPKSSEAKDLKYELARLDTKQLVIKILINSLYGVFGNKQASFGDDDIASSVTLTGQAVIKQSNEIIKQFIKKDIPNMSSQEEESIVIYNDTDSCFITIKPYIDRKMFEFSKDNIITEETYDKLSNMEEHLNKTINEWAQKNLLSIDNRFNFKREKICDVGIFLQKKRYVLRILDNEGKKINKFKYTGVEVVRSTMPNAIKPYAKKIIETMLLSKSLRDTNDILNQTYDVFKNLTPEEIAFVMGVKGYDKYASRCRDMNTVKGMPIHVKSAYFHNHLMKNVFKNPKFESISSGDKIRYVYVQTPNKYNISSIGFKYTYPDEFKDALKVDYELMFEKILFESIRRFYESANWQIRKPTDNVKTELFDLFS